MSAGNGDSLTLAGDGSGGERLRRLSHRATPSIPFTDAEQGTCRWCGTEIRKPDGSPNLRRRWHPDCIEEYRGTWPAAWRQRVFNRDGGVCADCDHDLPHVDWEADHITPLIDGGTWTLENAQTLCAKHHHIKTSNENSNRAMMRRATREPLRAPGSLASSGDT